MIDEWMALNWTVPLLALLFGAIIGGVLRGGCRSRLLEMEEQWSKRYQNLENDCMAKAEQLGKVQHDHAQLVQASRKSEHAARVFAKNLKEREQEVRRQREDVASFGSERLALQTEIRELNSRLADFDNEIALLNSQLDESKSALAAKEASINELESELVSLQEQARNK